MMRAQRGNQAVRERSGGYTLAEALVSMTILGILLVGVSSLYFASYRLWRRGEPANTAERAAALAVQRMVPDLRSGLLASELDSPNNLTGIRIRLPARTWDASEAGHLNVILTDAVGAPYLAAGDYVLYYRGTEYGYATPTGSVLWRVLAQPDGHILRQTKLVENVVDNPPLPGQTEPKPMFLYWPDVTRLKSVEITVTVREAMGSESATVTMLSELTLRNH
jgi:type II secretory pathway pseudopilin PulG